ncbi:MAG: LysM peptidoglycan-binding domain-containing protein, partial [Candidatus Aminicenantes bacterium]|nr:LysM peptidoglycan-binding domain-containing protein [Candidatus Aminicenantes bacterium]
QLPQEADITQKEQNPSELLEEALDAYQDARIAWERGDFDTSLAALDEAYSLILKLELPQDSSLIQAKNDLRLLIAQRIQEIYGSRLITAGDNHQTIPLVENKHVLAEIKSFQTKEKKDFEEAYKRSGRYKEMINEEMKKAGLPEELSWMPIIESGFKVNAYSRARALGLWQFISSTGYRFGLKRDRWIDERMDPVKATQAAIKYLNELHSLFGDWTTALAAYNCGEFRVQRVIRLQRIEYLDNFWDLYTMLPKETARFVPRLIATLLIINNPEKYGFNLPSPDPPLRYETIKINRPIRLSSLSKKLGLGSEALASLNSELRYKATPEHEYLLKIPIGSGGKALAAVNSISRWIPPEATYVYHYVRRGETVSGIAKRYRTSISSIARLNRLSRNYLIRPGQRLKVPGRGRSYVSARPFQLIKDGEKLVYIVRRGDSLYRIANSFSTTVQRIKKENNLRSDNLSIGQKLVIQSGRPEGATLYTVKTGDTPFEIAKKYRMNLNTLLNLNGLHSRSKIYPGQKLWVTPNNKQ